MRYTLRLMPLESPEAIPQIRIMACQKSPMIRQIMILARADWPHEFGITLQQLPVIYSKDRGRTRDPTRPCQEFVLNHLLTVSSSSCISIIHNSLVGTSLVTYRFGLS